MQTLKPELPERSSTLKKCLSNESREEFAIAKQPTDGADGRPHFKTLPPSRLISTVATRMFFILSLELEGPSDTLNIFEERGELILRERFRVGDASGGWLELEMTAPVESDPSYPHVAVSVRFPLPALDTTRDRHAALSLVNDMNLFNAACSTCLDPESGQIAIRARMAFTGFNDVAESHSAISAAQEEATLNMLVEVVSTAIEWEKRVVGSSSLLVGSTGALS